MVDHVANLTSDLEHSNSKTVKIINLVWPIYL